MDIEALRQQNTNTFLGSFDTHYVYSEGQKLREDGPVRSKAHLLENVRSLFPEVYNKYNLGSIQRIFMAEYEDYRPPYENKIISCYVFEPVTSLLKEDFSIANNYQVPFYALKFDTISMKYYLKSFTPDVIYKEEDPVLYDTIVSCLPKEAETSPGYCGFLQDNKGKVFPFIDMYFNCEESKVLEWCLLNNITFPYNLEDNLSNKLMGWSCVYDKEAKQIVQIKAYAIK